MREDIPSGFRRVSDSSDTYRAYRGISSVMGITAKWRPKRCNEMQGYLHGGQS